MPLSPQEDAKIAKYEELLANEPNTLVFAALGSLYARQYNFERAVEVLDNGLQYFPNYFSARVLLAKCYLALNLFDAAIVELEIVIEVDPNNVSALALLGDEHRNRGRNEKARIYYEKVLDLDPNNEEFQYKLHLLDEAPDASDITLQADGPAATRQEDEPSIEDEPDNFDERDSDLATVTLARIYIDQGLVSKARYILEVISKRDPNNREVIELREQLKLVDTAGKITAPTARKIATKLEAIQKTVEKDEFEIDFIDRLNEASANLKKALSPIITPQPDEGTFGTESFKIADVPENGEGGGDNLVLNDSIAEIFMIEFRLPETRVLAGELGINEILLEEQLSIQNDEFVIDTKNLARKAIKSPDARPDNAISPGNGIDSADKQELIGDTAITSNNVTPDDNSSTSKLQPEDILIYRPDDLDFGKEADTEIDIIKIGDEPNDEIGKSYFDDEIQLLELDDNPFEEENRDFLGWLDSINLKEI